VYCNPSKAQKVLNWKAEVSIEESVRNGLKVVGGEQKI
jgi:nucleoside-diphosphate-sugar epimerase